MLLATMGFIVIFALLILVVTKKASVHFCLVILPILAAAVCGYGIDEIGGFMSDGLVSIAPTAIMLTFAVMFFGVMYDAGLFDPAIKGVIQLAGGDPMKVAVGTAIIAVLAHLDGSGSSTYLVTISALMPVYKALNMSIYTLATITALSAGVMNILPWGGPTMRAAAVLEMNVTELFQPLIPLMAIGLVWVLLVSGYLGYRERKRVGITSKLPENLNHVSEEAAKIKRPDRFIPNLILTLAAIIILILAYIPMEAVFVIALPICLMINYPSPAVQKERLEAQAPTAIYTASVIFCAGVFTGVLSGSGMIDAMANALASLIPTSLGQMLAPVISIVSIPMTIFFDADSMYYGVLPVISKAAETFGVSAEMIARAFLLGGHTTAFPLTPVTGSTWVLLGLTGIDIGTHQKKTLPWVLGSTTVMLIAALAMGVIT